MSTFQPNEQTAFTPEHLGLDTLVEFVEASLDGIVVCDVHARYLYANPVACEIMGYSLDELVGQDFRMNFPERLHQELIDAFNDSIAGRTGRHSSALLRPDGEEREIEYSNMHFTVDGETILSAIFHDVTNLRRQAREAATLADIASAMTVDLTMEETVNVLAASVMDASSAVASAVIIVDLKMSQFKVAGICNLPEGYKDALASTWPPAPTSVSLMATATQQPQIRHNARSRILALPNYSALHPYVRDAEWDTILATPIVYHSKAIGVLMTFYPENWVVNNDELAFLQAIADQTAVTIENHRLYQEAQSKAALEERQRLSRELHDSVSQALYGIGLGATTARRLLEQEPGKAAAPLDYVLSLAEAGLAEMRALIFDLRPESLETEGLVAALEKQAASLRARHRIDVQVEMCCEPEIPLQVKESVYRIAQEAMTNTVRHARATQVRLCLEDNTTNILTLRLQDNGIGFHPEESYEDHRGLRSMRDIASRLGGTLRIESTPGGGTQTRVEIPVSLMRQSE
jgi:PAS domain S-box-containing protein